ncbi:MAG TPA: GNAT family N-acetyltransferase [Gemmatimonadaceae bacterium]|nr:GNAT family N-acetyltransferase [Gemmatimonadaceae bacterium]
MIRFTPSKKAPPVEPPRILVGDMTAKYRDRVREIVVATGVFNDAEVAVALELFDAAFGEPDGTDHAHAAFTHQPPASSDYFFLGAFTPEEELAGFACYGPTPGTDRTYDLYWIAVHPAAQGTGSGTILLNEVERRLKGLNARMVVVETSSRSDYKNTRGFYIRRGYVEAARARDFYAPADDRITFTKRLQSRGPAIDTGAWSGGT